MGTYFKAIDRFAASLTRGVIAHRWLVILGAVIVAGVIGSGASKLEFSTNYRVFLSSNHRAARHSIAIRWQPLKS
jgi:predicted RND superfamily exporter protein